MEKEEIDYFKRDESVDKEDEEGGGGGGVILKKNNNCNFSYFLVIVLNMYFVCLNWMGAQFYLQNGKLCT